jgi:hypothetical protein
MIVKLKLRKYLYKNFIMKNLPFLLMIMLAFFSACEKKKTPVTSNNSSNQAVAGNWTFTGMTQDNGQYTEGGVLVGTYTASSSNPSGSMTLNTDGTYSISLGYDYAVNWNIGGTTYTDHFNMPVNSTSGNYSYAAGTQKITFLSGGQSGTYDVINNTATTFAMKIFVSQTSTSGGIVEVSSNYTTFSFIR